MSLLANAGIARSSSAASRMPIAQRLAPYEKFAEMIDRHWNGIAAYCKPENKVSLGFVEGLNNKIRVIQRELSPLEIVLGGGQKENFHEE